MAAKQKLLFQLQQDVDSDDQWQADVLWRPGLSVVDVYPDWAGPCVAMRDQLIRFKLVEGGDNLHLFTANASLITSLARFNDHSEPTWMILGSGKLVNLYIGCNCPEILRLVRTELRRELRVMAGKAKRKTMPFDKPTPAELRRQARLDAVRRREQDAVEAQRLDQQRAVRVRAYCRLAEALRDFTAVLFLPHSLDDDGQLPTIAETLKSRWREMGFGVLQTVQVDVTELMAGDIFWERRLPQHDELVESMRAGACVALLVTRQRSRTPGTEEGEASGELDQGAQGDAPVQARPREEEELEEPLALELGQIEQIIAESIYGFYPGPGPAGTDMSTSREDSSPSEFFSPVGQQSTPELDVVRDHFRISDSSWLRRRQSSLTPTALTASGQHIFEHEDEQEDGIVWRYGEGGMGSSGSLPGGEYPYPDELRPMVDSVAAMLLRRDNKVTLPGVWTPLTPVGKAAAVHTLFRTFTNDIYEEEPVPPPPPTTSVVVFRAYKRENVWQVINNFPGDLLHYGFFTEDKLRLASTVQQYEKLAVKEPKDRLVLEVASTRSAPLLALAEVGCSYMSPNKAIAKTDVEEYFSPAVRDAPIRLPPEPEPSDDEEPVPTVPEPQPIVAPDPQEPAAIHKAEADLTSVERLLMRVPSLARIETLEQEQIMGTDILAAEDYQEVSLVSIEYSSREDIKRVSIQVINANENPDEAVQLP